MLGAGTNASVLTGLNRTTANSKILHTIKRTFEEILVSGLIIARVVFGLGIKDTAGIGHDEMKKY